MNLLMEHMIEPFIGGVHKMNLSAIEKKYTNVIKHSIFLKMSAKPSFILSDSFRFHLCPFQDKITLIFVVSVNEGSFSRILQKHGYFLKKELNDLVDNHLNKCHQVIHLLKSVVKKIFVFQIELLLTFNTKNELESCTLNIIIDMDDIVQMYEIKVNIDDLNQCQYFYRSIDSNKNFCQNTINPTDLGNHFIIEFIRQKLRVLKLDNDIDLESISIKQINEYLNLISMHSV